MIDFVCPSCKAILKIHEEDVGKSGTCNKCGNHITISMEIPSRLSSVLRAVWNLLKIPATPQSQSAVSQPQPDTHDDLLDTPPQRISPPPAPDGADIASKAGQAGSVAENKYSLHPHIATDLRVRKEADTDHLHPRSRQIQDGDQPTAADKGISHPPPHSVERAIRSKSKGKTKRRKVVTTKKVASAKPKSPKSVTPSVKRTSIPKKHAARKAKISSASAVQEPKSLPFSPPISGRPTRLLGIETFVAFDLETSGLSPKSHGIIEVAGIKFSSDGEQLDKFQELANPGHLIPPEATRVNGITNQMVRGARPSFDVVRQFVHWVGSDAILLAHNARFDTQFLAASFRNNGYSFPSLQIVDTCPWARECFPALKDHKLGTLLKHIGVSTQGLHRAMADAHGVVHLVVNLVSHAPDAGLEIRRRAKRLE